MTLGYWKSSHVTLMVEPPHSRRYLWHVKENYHKKHMTNLSISQEQTHHKVTSSSFSLRLAHIIADPAMKIISIHVFKS